MIPFIESLFIEIQETKSYNVSKIQITLASLNINITPEIFKFLTKVYKIYLQTLEDYYKISNRTLNNLRIVQYNLENNLQPGNVGGNIYKVVKLKPLM